MGPICRHRPDRGARGPPPPGHGARQGRGTSQARPRARPGGSPQPRAQQPGIPTSRIRHMCRFCRRRGELTEFGPTVQGSVASVPGRRTTFAKLPAHLRQPVRVRANGCRLMRENVRWTPASIEAPVTGTPHATKPISPTRVHPRAHRRRTQWRWSPGCGARPVWPTIVVGESVPRSVF